MSCGATVVSVAYEIIFAVPTLHFRKSNNVDVLVRRVLSDIEDFAFAAFGGNRTNRTPKADGIHSAAWQRKSTSTRKDFRYRFRLSGDFREYSVHHKRFKCGLLFSKECFSFMIVIVATDLQRNYDIAIYDI